MKTTIKVQVTGTPEQLTEIYVDAVHSGTIMTAWDWGFISQEYGSCARVNTEYNGRDFIIIPIEYLMKIEEGE